MDAKGAWERPYRGYLSDHWVHRERTRREGPWGTAWCRVWCLVAAVAWVILVVVVSTQPSRCHVVLSSDGTWASTDARAQPHHLEPGCRLVWQP